MKKKQMFVTIDSLGAAGAEKSLITFLSVLDYTRFDVDLQLFNYGGEFEKYIPKEVHVLPPFEYTEFANQGFVAQLKSMDFRKLCARLAFSLSLRKPYHLTNGAKARLYWKHVGPCLPAPAKTYDVAVAYAQGVPTLFVAGKVKAREKLSWVNVDYRLEGVNRDFQRPFYAEIDHIVPVSDSALRTFQGIYPEFAHKMTVIRDMLDANFINRLAGEPMEKPMDTSVPALVTVARLNKDQKGYDITLEACRLLRDRGVRFHWYAVGRGPYREEMERYLAEHHLQDVFHFVGATPNPYPYISNATLYVQTSRHEGYGLSIAEARILNRPVVTTEFAGVYNQMVPGKNGLVVKMTPEAVADGVEWLLADKALYNAIQQYQMQEKKGNTEEIEKFYQLVEA